MGGALPSTTPGQSTGVTTSAASTNLGVGLLLSMTQAPDSNLLYVGSPATDAFAPSIPAAAPGNRHRVHGHLGPGHGPVKTPACSAWRFTPSSARWAHRTAATFICTTSLQIGGVRVHSPVPIHAPGRPGRPVTPTASSSSFSSDSVPTLHRGGGLLFGTRWFSVSEHRRSGLAQVEPKVHRRPLHRRRSSHRRRPRCVAQPSDRHGAVALGPGQLQPGATTFRTRNPWVGQANVLEEFFAIGCRNPHRMSIDRTTGRILIGNVGSNTERWAADQPRRDQRGRGRARTLAGRSARRTPTLRPGPIR